MLFTRAHLISGCLCGHVKREEWIKCELFIGIAQLSPGQPNTRKQFKLFTDLFIFNSPSPNHGPEGSVIHGYNRLWPCSLFSGFRAVAGEFLTTILPRHKNPGQNMRIIHWHKTQLSLKQPNTRQPPAAVNCLF